MKRISEDSAANISLAVILVLISLPAHGQTIDISSGLSEVESQLSSIYTSVLNIGMVLFGIGALIGLIITAYQLYTDEHGNACKKSLSWFGILGFIVLAIYVIKQMFN